MCQMTAVGARGGERTLGRGGAFGRRKSIPVRFTYTCTKIKTERWNTVRVLSVTYQVRYQCSSSTTDCIPTFSLDFCTRLRYRFSLPNPPPLPNVRSPPRRAHSSHLTHCKISKLKRFPLSHRRFVSRHGGVDLQRSGRAAGAAPVVTPWTRKGRSAPGL